MSAEPIPMFFVPFVEPEDQEEAYSSLARWCGSSVPPPGERIYSISFRHDGVDWVATVGQRLRGTQLVTRGRGSKRTERPRHHGDNATIIAIFPGYPYVVCHDNKRSQWANPFFAGTPTSTTMFK